MTATLALLVHGGVFFMHVGHLFTNSSTCWDIPGHHTEDETLDFLVSLMYFHQDLVLEAFWYDHSRTVQ